MCASTFPPAWLGRHPQWARKQKARNPGGQEKDAAFPFPLHPTGLLLPSHHPFKPNSFILIKSCQGLSTHHADRACCIFVPSLRNSPVVAGERAPQRTPRTGKSTVLGDCNCPSDDQPHIGLVVRRPSWPADLPQQISQAVAAVSFHHAWPSKGQNSGSCLFLPGSGQTCGVCAEEETLAAENSGS